MSLTYAYLLMDASATRSITQAKTDIIMRFTGRDQFKTYLRLPQDISTHWGSKRSELFGEKVFGKTARNNRKTIGDRVQL